MNCLECQDLVQQRLDGKPIAAPDALEHHLEHCTDCRDQHAAALRLLEGIQQLPKFTLPTTFAQDIAAQVMQDRRQRRARTQRRIYVTLALAASVLLVLFAAYWRMPRTQLDKPKEEIARKNEKPAPIVPPEPRKDETKNAFASLTERLADTTRDHAKVVLVAADLDRAKLPLDDIPMIEPGVREATQEVGDGVRTVTRNARKAFDFFARELPMP